MLQLLAIEYEGCFEEVMSHYIHHVPGRLRIKTLRLKRNEVLASSVCKLLAGTPGVLDCEVKTVTGSVIISYDGSQTDRERLLWLLKSHDVITEIVKIDEGGKAGPVSKTASAVIEGAGKAAFGFLVEKAVERSAVALIGAIL
jgi:hypothetical protein